MSASFVIALLRAALMGLAIQRGTTCLVAAVTEAVAERRVSRLAAMLEAGLRVAAGVLAAHAFGRLAMAPQDSRFTIATIAGGVALGLGALINGACLFGSVARIGSGQWAHVATLLGFFLGCLGGGRFAAHPQPSPGASALLAGGTPVALALALAIAWRGYAFVRAHRASANPGRQWTPHQATLTIGLAFIILMLTFGNWAYTQVLADLARGIASGVGARLILFGALLAGAVVGGGSAGVIRPPLPASGEIGRCLTGGLKMGVGGLMVPGGNDGLILYGLPLRLPYDWVALFCMALTIAVGVGVLARRAIAGRASRSGDAFGGA